MKILKTAVLVVGAVAAIATGVGAIVGGAAFLAATGVALSTVAAIGTLASVAGMALNFIAPPKPKGGALSGSQTSFRLDPAAGIPYAIGRTAFGGSGVHRETWGKDNEYQGLSIVWSGGGPIQAIEQFQASREAVNFAGMSATGKYAGYMWLNSQLGACPSPALASPSGNYPGVDGDFKLSGYAASNWVVKLDVKEGKKFAGGLPSPLAVLQGVKVYDPRLDSTYPGGSGACRPLQEGTYVYSENPWLHALTWALGRWQNAKKVIGVGMALAAVNVPSFVEAANIADANGWKAGGVVSSVDDKWSVLEMLAQAGGGQCARLGAKLTAFVDAPRVSIATIRTADLVGKGRVASAQMGRDKLNGVVPVIRSEANGWEQVPCAAVRFDEYVAEDGKRRTAETPMPLVQQADQAAELAAYQVLNSREFGPIDLPLAIRWLGLEPGDQVAFDIPELGLNGQDGVALVRGLDPGTGNVNISFRSETAGKHALALGKTTVVPPSPTLIPRDLSVVPAPEVAAWNLQSASEVGANGEVVPLLAIIGATDNLTADSVLVRYRRVTDPVSPWSSGGNFDPAATRIEIHGVAPSTAYEVEIAYRVLGVVGSWRSLGNEATGVLTAGGFVNGGDLAYEDAIYFNSPQLLEALGGAPATLANFKTVQGTAAGIIGQAPAATDPTIAPGATNDTGADTRSVDSTPMYYRLNWERRLRFEFKDAALMGVSSSSGYVGLETYAVWGDPSGGPVWQRATNAQGQRYIRYSQGGVGAETWVGWQPEYSGNRRPGFDSDIAESVGGATATLGNFKTPIGIAAGFAGQGALAVRGTIDGDVHLSGPLAARLAPHPLDVNFINSNRLAYSDGTLIGVLKPGEGGANITESRVSAAFAGQAAIATSGSWSDLGSTPVRLRANPTFGETFLDHNLIVWSTGTSLDGLRPGEFGSNVTENRSAASIAGQSPWATFNDAANAPAKLQGVARGAGTSGLLRAFGSYSQVVGNQVAKFGGTHGAYQGGAIGQGLVGPAFITGSLLSPLAGGGWYTVLGLDADPANVNGDASTVLLRSVASASYINVSLIANGVTVTGASAVTADSRLMLAWDGSHVHAVLDGSVLCSLEAQLPALLYPKVFDFYQSGTSGMEIADILYGPYVANGIVGLRLYDMPGNKHLVEGNRVSRRPASGTGWDGNVWSRESFRGGAVVSGCLEVGNCFLGIRAGSETGGSYSDIQWSFYRDGTSVYCWTGAGGLLLLISTSLNPKAQLSLVHDGYTVRWMVDGAEVASTTSLVSPSDDLRVGIACYNAGARVASVSFRPFNGERGANKTETRVSSAVAGQTAWATFAASTGRVGKLADSGRVLDPTIYNTQRILGPSSTTSLSPTYTVGGSNVTVNLPSHTRKIAGPSGPVTLSYGATSGVVAFSAYWVAYIDDPDLTGFASPTATFSSDPDVLLYPGRYQIASGIAPASNGTGGGTGSGGGGGGGFDDCVAADSWVEVTQHAERPFVEIAGRVWILARNVLAGDFVRCLVDGEDRLEWREVERNFVVPAQGVRLVSASGVVIDVSDCTPITQRDGSCVPVLESAGAELAIDREGLVGWEPFDVRPIGPIEVAHLCCGNGTYLAGNRPGVGAFTHNPIQKP